MGETLQNRVGNFFAPSSDYVGSGGLRAQYPCPVDQPHGYDTASDVRKGPNVYTYVVQNPWTRWDPLGLAASEQDIDTAFDMQPAPLRWFARVTGMEYFMKKGMKNQSRAAQQAEATGDKVATAETAKNMAITLVPDAVIVATMGRMAGTGEQEDPGGDSAQDTYEEQQGSGGAKDAPLKPTTEEKQEWIYGPKDDPKVNDDGSTGDRTWTTPDDFGTQGEAEDKLDPFKPLDGRRPVTIPEGTPSQEGVTPGGENPQYPDRQGGANERLIPGGLPPGSTGEWEPLEQ